MSGAEQRHFSRVALPIPVRVRHGQAIVGTNQTVDLSASGLAVESDEPVAVGAACTVELLLDDSTTIEAQAEVTRRFEGGFAVRIVQIELESFDLLKNLVRFNAQDPDRAEAEFAAHVGLRPREAS